jgi:dienelactone hydrolase
VARVVIPGLAWAGLVAACGSRPAPPAPAPAPRFEIAPARALVDEPLSIRVAGVAPGARVTLRATMARSPEVAWQSWAVFVADASGRIDAGKDAPVEGSYEGVDAMGLVWSMTPTSDAWMTAPPPGQLDPMHIHVHAERDGAVFAELDVERLRVAADVTRHEVSADGLVGALFLPPGASQAAPAPGVLVLGGSEGGMREDTAALLASHGYATLALVYFGAGALPAKMENIPLEYFEKALAWMANHEAIDGERMAVQGISRGGELALLVASSYPALVHAVVAHVPSGVVWPGIGRLPPQPAWTRDGVALPSASLQFDAATGAEIGRKMRSGEPIALAPLFRPGMADRAAMAAAEIPVERIRGPVLLISARDDQLWPSTELSEIAVARLRAHQHPYAVEHLAYEAAGHLIMAPYRITSMTAMIHPALHMKLALGGTPAGAARANAESWPRVLSFLADALRK